MAFAGREGETQDARIREMKKAEVYEYIWSLADKRQWRGEWCCVSYLLEDLL